MEEKQRNSRRSDQEWIALIQECRTSGLGDREWCELHGIPISTFYTKITKLRRKACDIKKVKNRPRDDVRPVIHRVPSVTVFICAEQRPGENKCA